MNDSIFLNKLEMRELCFTNTYTTGSLQSYQRPCIGYITRGMGKFFYNGNTYFAHEGDLIYIAKDTKYYSVWYGDPDIKFYSISFEFEHPYAFYGYRFQIVHGIPSESLEKIYEYLEGDPLRAASYMYTLLADLYPKMSSEDSPPLNESIEQAITYIESNYTSKLEISDLCKKCHLSRSSLFELFKRRTGVSPITYKHTVMIQHALDMLSHTDMTVDEISQNVGFSSSNYFRTVFTKMTGKTPKEMRR